MKKPNRFATFLLSLIGQSRVYDTVEEVEEVIRRNVFDLYEQRVETHSRSAARITDPLGFQPDLVALHDELTDTWHFLMALEQRARDLGRRDLADSMKRASDSTAAAMWAVDEAAEQTVRSPSGLRNR